MVSAGAKKLMHDSYVDDFVEVVRFKLSWDGVAEGSGNSGLSSTAASIASVVWTDVVLVVG